MKKLFIYDVSLIPILFPGYRITEDMVYAGSGPMVLMWGSGKVPEELTLHHDLIVRVPLVSSSVDIQLVDRDSVIKWMSSFGVRASVTASKQLLKLTDEQFVQACARAAVLRRWEKEERIEGSVFKIFEGLTQSRGKFAEQWFAASRSYPWSALWGSVLTFLGRAEDFESRQSNLSESYRKLLYAASQRFNGGKGRMLWLLRIRSPSEIHVFSALMDLVSGDSR